MSSLSPRPADLAFNALAPHQREALQEAFHSSDPLLRQEATLAALAGAGHAQELRSAMLDWPDANPAEAVSLAAENGRSEALAIALSAFDPADFHPRAAALAIQNGHADCLVLLARSQFSEDQCDALRLCAIFDQPDCAQILLNTGAVHPQTAYSNDVPELGFMSPIDWAASKGHALTLGVLLLARERSPKDALPLVASLILAAQWGDYDSRARRLVCAEVISYSLSPSQLVQTLHRISEDGNAQAFKLIFNTLPPNIPVELELKAFTALIQAAQHAEKSFNSFIQQQSLDQDRECDWEFLGKQTLFEQIQGQRREILYQLIKNALLDGRHLQSADGAVDLIRMAEDAGEPDSPLPESLRLWQAEAEALRIQAVTADPNASKKTSPRI